MTSVGLPSLVEGFFTKRPDRSTPGQLEHDCLLPGQVRLLLGFAKKRLKRPPSKLTLADLNAPFVASFLDELESDRANDAGSRNVPAWPDPVILPLRRLGSP